jgi:RNA polymerase sigma factor for flagellar operon FliA
MAGQQPDRVTDRDLWLAYKRHGDPDAKKKLVEKHLKLIDYVVNRMVTGLPRNLSRDDLTSLGVMGLIDAIEKFDYGRGLQFETYATWRIRGAIIDGLRQNDWVPRSVREKFRRLEEAYQTLEQTHLRTVSDREVMAYMQMDEREFGQLQQDIALSSVVSLEEPLKEDEPETRLSVLVDDRAKNPERKVHEMYLKECLARAIERLTERERTVITLFYYEELTLGEIAEVMSLTPSRISQLHSKAMMRLRSALEHAKDQLMREN